MAIKGISDIDRLPRIGKLRLGLKAKNAKGAEYPMSTDYFVFDPDDESVIQNIKDVYGDKPKSVDVMFAVDDIEQVFPQYMKRYSYNTLVCKGDGENATETVFEKKADGSVTRTGEKPVKCVGCQYNDKQKCKPVANLMFMLPRIQGIGIWQLDTGSFHSIVGVNAGLKLVKQLYKRISGIPLRLLLNPKVVKADGRAKTVYVLSLSIEGTLQQALKEHTANPALIEGDKAKALMPKPDESQPDHIIDAVEEVEELHNAMPTDDMDDMDDMPAEDVKKIQPSTEPDSLDPVVTDIQDHVITETIKNLGFLKSKEHISWITKVLKDRYGVTRTKDLSKSQSMQFLEVLKDYHDMFIDETPKEVK